MSALRSHKRLLIAESELNRAQLAQDIVELRGEVFGLAERAKSFKSVAGSVAVLLASVVALRRRKQMAAGAKPSWPRTILRGAGLLSNLWLAFRAQRRGRDGS